MPTEVPTEVPAAVPAEAAEEKAAEGSQTVLDEVRSVMTELDTVGERMMTSEAFIVLDTAGKSVWKVPLAGLEFQVPDYIKDAHGGIRAMGGRETITGTGIVSMNVVYLSMTEAEYYDLVKKLADYTDDTEDIDEFYGVSTRYMETSRALNSHRHPLFSIMGIGNDQGPEEILAAERKERIESGLWTEEELDAEPETRTFTKIGSAEDYNFFFVQEPMDADDLAAAAADGEQYKAEYETLFNAKDQITPNFTFMRPLALAQLVSEGTGLTFKTKDLNDNPVNSKDLFSGHKATMLNIWETTCSACMSEMPELKELAEEFEAKGGQIVGLVYDAMDDDLIREAKEIGEDLGLNFVNLLPTQEMHDFFKIQAFPTTYFFNEKGEVVGDPIVGVNPEGYVSRMNEMLENK